LSRFCLNSTLFHAAEMDSIVDIVRMEVLTNASKNEKNKWKYLILLAILSNYRKFLAQLAEIFRSIFRRLGMIKKCIGPTKRAGKQPKSMIKLKFSKNETNNKIFKELLSRHGTDFDVVQLKDPHQWHVVNPKVIKLADDIFFRLDFAERCETSLKEKKKKRKGEHDGNEDSGDDENDKNCDETQQSTDYEMTDSRGQVFSYNLTLQELLDYVHKNYVPPEPTFVAPSEITTKLELFNMEVGRVTKFDPKTGDICGEWLTFTVSKNLDNVFLEPDIKERLMSQVDRFNDPLWYAERGLPRTLGILLYGEPGCGKTSFIKAISSYMDRRVLIVDFKLVHTVSQLRQIFKGFMNDDKRENLSYKFPRNKTVYVFEDFDCMSDIFLDRKLKDEEEKTKDTERKDGLAQNIVQNMLMYRRMEMLQQKRMIERASKRKNKKKTKDVIKNKDDANQDGDDENGRHVDDDDTDVAENFDPFDDDGYFGYMGPPSGGAKWATTYRSAEKVTLADFLELLDGIVEMDGRIIIMTTNKREKMDSALVRPGRIDLDLELRPPSRWLIAHIFKHMYKHFDEVLLRALFFKYYDHLPENLVSTARVMNSFMFTNPEQGMIELIKCGKDARSKSDAAESQSVSENDDPNVESMIASFEAKDHFAKPSWTSETIWDNVVAAQDAKSERPTIGRDVNFDLWTIFATEDVDVRMSSHINLHNGYIKRSIMNINEERYWFSNDPWYPGPHWILFDFVSYTVNIAEYVIKIRQGSDRRIHSWNLEGSRDGKSEWIPLISHKEDPSFVDPNSLSAHFVLPKKPETFRYLRLISTGNLYYTSTGEVGTSDEGLCNIVTVQFFGTAKKFLA